MAKMVWKTSEDLFQELKEIKKSELSTQCQNDILSGFECEVDGHTYHFSYDREAQTNLQERWQLFQNNMVEQMNITAKLNGEHVRLEVDKEKFDQIYIASVIAKENKIKRLREDLYPLVDRAKNEAELNDITWDMEVIDPEPELIVVNGDRLLNDEVKRIEVDSAVTSNEIINLIIMSQMMGGM